MDQMHLDQKLQIHVLLVIQVIDGQLVILELLIAMVVLHSRFIGVMEFQLPLMPILHY